MHSFVLCFESSGSIRKEKTLFCRKMVFRESGDGRGALESFPRNKMSLSLFFDPLSRKATRFRGLAFSLNLNVNVI